MRQLWWLGSCRRCNNCRRDRRSCRIGQRERCQEMPRLHRPMLYNAGYNAGATRAKRPQLRLLRSRQQALFHWTDCSALPAGCITPTVQGTTYYLCGNTWFSAAYGANGVYYRVVPVPILEQEDAEES